MITDAHPSDRLTRVLTMIRSDLSEERDVAARELRQMFASHPELVSNVHDALYPAADGAPAPPCDLPDTDWKESYEQLGTIKRLRLYRRLNGRTLVVCASGSPQGGYYAVMDGHHLSAHGARETYRALLDAIVIAEAAARGEWPESQPMGDEE